MSKQISQLRQEVMTRVRFIYFSREVLNSPTVKALAIFLLATISTWFFSVSDVVANMSAATSSFSDLSVFVWSALVNAHLGVQITLALLAAVTVFLARDVFQAIREPRSVWVTNF